MKGIPKDECNGEAGRGICIKINDLEIPTGNPLLIEFDEKVEIKKYYYLDKDRSKKILVNQ